MFEPEISSKLLANAVEQLSKLPGVGKKSAMRYALYLLRQTEDVALDLSNAITKLRTEACYCSKCNMLSDTPVCPICSDSHRDNSIVCVVESIREVMSIENTGRYKGLYHVLGGIISPMEGIGPSNLAIDSLEKRLAEGDIKEVVLALSTTMEGETTCFYLYKIVSKYGVEVSTIARGVGFGDDLEYTDEITLGRSIEERKPFKL